jgi:hypothetical protein
LVENDSVGAAAATVNQRRTITGNRNSGAGLLDAQLLIGKY